MPFINEAIPADMRASVREWSLQKAGIDRALFDWTIDHERKIFLVCYSYGRMGPGPSAMRGQFAIFLDTTPVVFQAQPDLEHDETDPTGYTRFTAFPPKIPAELTSRREQIRELIVEGLTVLNQPLGGGGRTEVQFFEGARQ